MVNLEMSGLRKVCFTFFAISTIILITITVSYGSNLFYLVSACLILSVLSAYLLTGSSRIIVPLGAWLSSLSITQLLVLLFSIIYPYNPALSTKVLAAALNLGTSSIVLPTISILIPHVFFKPRPSIRTLKLERRSFNIELFFESILGASLGTGISFIKIARLELAATYAIGVLTAGVYFYNFGRRRSPLLSVLSWISMFVDIILRESKSFNHR